jgi:hypothetical protein
MLELTAAALRPYGSYLRRRLLDRDLDLLGALMTPEFETPVTEF